MPVKRGLTVPFSIYNTDFFSRACLAKRLHKCKRSVFFVCARQKGVMVPGLPSGDYGSDWGLESRRNRERKLKPRYTETCLID